MLRYLLQKKSAPLSTLVSRWRTLVDDPLRPHIREIADKSDLAVTLAKPKIMKARIDLNAEAMANKHFPGSDLIAQRVRESFKEEVIKNANNELKSMQKVFGLGEKGGVVVSTKLPMLRSAALQGRLQNLKFGRAFSEVKKLIKNPQADDQGLRAIVGMHELFEYGSRKHQGTKKLFFSHVGPRVLTAESNLLARLTPDELFNEAAVRDARDTLLGLRSARPGLETATNLGIQNVSEKKVMEDAVRAVTGGRLKYVYGETHLPKAVRKRVENYLISQYGGPLG